MPDVFLGLSPGDPPEPFRLPLERHLLTIAASGAGKGVCLIKPNLEGPQAWPHSVLVVDPKGEAAEWAWQFRAFDLGQTVAVLDPFGDARGIPEAHRARVNPLDYVETTDDLHVLADGLVMRTANESQPHWNESAADVIAGMLAFLAGSDAVEPDRRHLGSLRTLLRNVTDAGTREAQLAAMAACTAFDGLAADTAARLSRDTSEVASILSTVQTQTRWLSSRTVCAAMTASELNGRPFDLHALKRDRLSLFLVLPPDKLELHGRFLRLFVRLALSVMQRKSADGAQKGTPCLFILDEFYSLGRIGEIQKAAGLMRSYGLHLWPFVQDIGQLEELYGVHGLNTFAGNADAVCCFGIGDFHTAGIVSGWIGQIGPDEVEAQAHDLATRMERSEALFGLLADGKGRAPEQVLRTLQSLVMSRLGKPRMAPDALIAHLARTGGIVADRMLAFSKGHALELVPCPRLEKPPLRSSERAALAARREAG